MWSLKSKNLSHWCLIVALATLPFQTSILLYQAGSSNPYTQVHFFVFEIFLLLSTFFFIGQKPSNKALSKIPSPLFSAILGILFLSLTLSTPADSLWNLLLATKLAEALLFYFLIRNHHSSALIKIFITVMSGEALLGLFQLFTGSSLGLTLLGEPHLSVHTLGLAKIDWTNFTFLRAYGTFPHPNVLGGFLAVSILLTLAHPFQNKHTKIWLLILQSLGLLATFSRSALLALALATVFFTFKKTNLTRIFFLAIPIFLFILFSRGTLPGQDLALTLRLHSFSEAWALLQIHPWGLGWNHYALFLNEVATHPLELWEYQPVHNIYLLFITETGLLGLLALATALFFTKKPRSRFLLALLFIPLLTGLFDHYWLSLPQGNFLAIFLLALAHEGSTAWAKSA